MIAAQRDQVEGGYVRELDDLEFSTATYVTQAFPRHFHETYSISVVEQGAGAVWCEGTNYILPPDGVTLINPGQVHTGGITRRGTPMHYRVLYPSVDLIERLAIGPRSAPPAFRVPSLVDTDTARRLSRLHRLLPDASRSLERDELLIDALARAFTASGTPTVLQSGRGAEPVGIRRVLEFLHAHATEPISLSALASPAPAGRGREHRGRGAGRRLRRSEPLHTRVSSAHRCHPGRVPGARRERRDRYQKHARPLRAALASSPCNVSAGVAAGE
jgi:hypothetical protein